MNRNDDQNHREPDQRRLPFGKFFEQQFRGSPVVIALTLLATGFVAGFGAPLALSALCPCA